MKVKGVWLSGTKWKHQCKRWWPETSWYDGGRGMYLEEWEVEWILIEKSKIPESSHVLWRKIKERVLYMSGGNISTHQGAGKNK